MKARAGAKSPLKEAADRTSHLGIAIFQPFEFKRFLHLNRKK